METGVSSAEPPGRAGGRGSSGGWKLCPGHRGSRGWRGCSRDRRGLWDLRGEGMGCRRAGKLGKAAGWEGRVAGGAQGLTKYLVMPEMWFLRVSSAVAPLRSCSWGEA